MQLKTIIGIIAGVLTAISMFPQLLKILHEKKAEDVSVFMLVILLGGVSSWMLYGILIKDAIIIATNCISLIINILTMFFRWKYSK